MATLMAIASTGHNNHHLLLHSHAFTGRSNQQQANVHESITPTGPCASNEWDMGTHMNPVAVSEVQERVKTTQERRVKRVFVTWLRTRPHHAEPDRIPPLRLDVINVGLVERVARRAVAKARASVVDDVVARRVAVNSREVRRSFHNHVWTNHHNWSTANARNELPPLHNHVSRSRRANPRRCRAEGARGVFVGRSATGASPTNHRALVVMQVWCAYHRAVRTAPNREHSQQRERCAPLHCPFGRTPFLGVHAARGVCVTCGLWHMWSDRVAVYSHTPE